MKIWLYYARVGNGHYSPAKALAEYCESKKHEVVWFDLGQALGGVSQQLFEKGYRLLIEHARPVYSLVYWLSSFSVVQRLIQWWTARLAVAKVLRSLQQETPDIIVSTYFLTGPISEALRRLKKTIPVVVVVTEPYSPPPIWFFNSNFRYIVASPEAKECALRVGISKDAALEFPQIVLEKKDTQSLEKFGLAKDKLLVLLLGGGEGYPKAEKIIMTFLKSDSSAQMVVVTGRNEAQAARCRQIVGRQQDKVVILGFVPNPQSLIDRAHMVLTKAGANTVREVLLARKPLLLTDYIWGQEKGTMEYVVKNELGWYEADPKRIIERIQRCVLGECPSAHTKKVPLRNGTSEVAEYIFSLRV
jgi:processive 1,2-diacylglycerol beta-glucosyltransferase/1,2-diacylglycerol 3-beta-galactosyltransferase